MSKYVGKKTEILVLRPLIEHGCKVSINFSRSILRYIIITIITPNNDHYELSFDPNIGYWSGSKAHQYFNNITSSKNLGDLVNYIIENEAIKS